MSVQNHFVPLRTTLNVFIVCGGATVSQKSIIFFAENVPERSDCGMFSRAMLGELPSRARY
ncbi:protein of unknown function (plasmid) [Caballeronia sp. S22]